MSNMNFPSQRYILKSHPCPSPASSNFRTEHQGRIADIRDQCWRGNLNLLGCKNLQGYVGLAWPTALEIPSAAPAAATRVCEWKIAQNHPARSAKINCSSCQPCSRVLHLATQSSPEFGDSQKQAGYSRPSQQLAPNQ